MSVRSSTRWVTASQVVRSGLQLASIAILARMLDSADYGLMALAGVITNLAYAVRDFGTTSAVIQRPRLDKPFEAIVFLVNLLIGLFLTIAVAGASFPAAMFFQSDRLQWVLLAVSPTFVIGSLSILQQAKLERISNFKQLALIEIAAALAGVLAAIVSALCGFGVYSLVCQAIVTTSFTSLFLIVRSTDYWPSAGPSKQSLNDLFSMSSSMTSYSVLVYLKSSVDTIILGRSLGDSILGAYNIAGKIALVPVQNIAWVCGRSLLPSMSASQNDMPRLKEIYIRSLAIVVFVCFPCMAWLWVLRDTFTVAVLGQRWSEAADILAWLAPVGVLNAIESTAGPVFVARGKPKILLVIGFFGICAVSVAMLIGSRVGLTGALCGLFLATLAVTLLSVAGVVREISLSPSTLLFSILPIVIASLIAATSLSFAISFYWIINLHPALQLCALFAIAILVYLTTTYFIARKPLLDLLSIVGLGPHR